jgi:hypothetical protein
VELVSLLAFPLMYKPTLYVCVRARARVCACCLIQYQAHSCYHTLRLSRALVCLFICLGIALCFTCMATKCPSHLHTVAVPDGGNKRH